jgi:beta-lactamase class A
MKRIGLLLAALMAATPPVTPLLAQTAAQAPTTATLSDRAAQLPAMLKGELDLASFFTPEFLAAVPPAQLTAISASLASQHGAPQAVDRIEAADAVRGVIYIRFERSVGQFQMMIDPSQGGRVSGLQVTGFSAIGDSIAKVKAEVATLHGATSLVVAELGANAQTELLAVNPDQPFAIGSTFKLYILAELADQTSSRKRAWGSVVPFNRRSFASQATGNWPMGAPVTLHSLAGWMISVSDNGATDTLLAILGRDAVGRRLTAIGNSVAPRTLPFLNTVEAFALKAESNSDLRTAFLAADEAEQRRLLDSAADRLKLEVIEQSAFTGKPLYIDSIEWFASSRDLVRLLDHLRTIPSPKARAIMAINSGVSADAAARWQYLGYKGGSESGVISMSFLLQSKAGRWYAVTGSWNDVSAPVDNIKFVGLMQRLVNLLAEQDAAKP